MQIDASLLDANSQATLEKAEKELSRVVESKLATALEKMDYDDICRYCKLHIPIRKKVEAMKSYSLYLRKTVEEEASKLHNSISQSRSKSPKLEN